MRIGIFGGSFDPIHVGHLILAEHCREQASLDQVLFIPSAQGPHKKNGAVGSDRQRVEMVDLAIGGHPSFLRSSVEIDRGGISYTVDTLEQLVQEHQEDELFLLIGGDSLNNFHTWKDPEKILSLAMPLVMARPGEGAVDFGLLADYVSPDRLAEVKALAITTPLVDISSTAIRDAAAEEKSFRYLTPRSVERYIQTQKVYQKRKAS
jgi:nicotinate-nucleotide adenylyltransferase